jgi:cobalt-precorrin-5B (C1)-methyltransferase
VLRKKLRSGYTTGACAAAAAKAAATRLLGAKARKTGSPEADGSDMVEIPFPDGTRVGFAIHETGLSNDKKTAWAAVIKDAGDDPDVTNGAQIVAEAREIPGSGLIIRGGKGVGVITKPGLSVDIGEHAINPVPRKMISEAVMEVLNGAGALEITISVPKGEELAKKTLNSRLGIIGGISILGTTGIVRPISADAWTATISASMNVAKAMGYDSIVLSAGRVSEKAHMKKFALPDESYVMMGDYLEFALTDAVRHGFKAVHLCAQWAKMLKIAMSTPHTHVRHGAIDMKNSVALLRSLGAGIPQDVEFNTAREIFDHIVSVPCGEERTVGSEGCRGGLFPAVCSRAKSYAETMTCGIPVIAHLVSYGGDIIATG